MIIADDLRNDLGCYGDALAVTPHLDRLAAEGMVFERAYCQQAVCNPSRASMLTGLRPDVIRVWDLHTHFRETLPDVVTLPQFFKKHGYHTRGVGKVFHNDTRRAEGRPPMADPVSWSVPPFRFRPGARPGGCPRWPTTPLSFS
jgi:iduronate 2-sulfatase